MVFANLIFVNYQSKKIQESRALLILRKKEKTCNESRINAIALDRTSSRKS